MFARAARPWIKGRLVELCGAIARIPNVIASCIYEHAPPFAHGVVDVVHLEAHPRIGGD